MSAGKWRHVEKLGMLSCFLTLLTLAVTLTIHARFIYVFDIDALNILTDVSLSKATLLHNFDQLMRYLNDPFQQTLQLADFSVSKQGAFHFQEVKRLFLLCYAILGATFVPSLWFLFQLKKRNRMWRLIRPLQWSMLAPIGLIFLALLGFDQFFTGFHQLLFRNDAWLFDPTTDPIILALPAPFFLHCFLYFFCLFELFLGGSLWLSRRVDRKSLRQ